MEQQEVERRDSDREWTSLEQAYKDHIVELKNKSDNLQKQVEQALHDKDQMLEDCDAKVMKLKSFYECELRTIEEETVAEKDKHLAMLEQDLDYLQNRFKCFALLKSENGFS